MKLLFVANARLPTEKAHGLQIMKTTEALIRQGVPVDLLLPERKNYITQSIADFYHLDSLPQITILKNPLAWLESRSKPLYFSLQRIIFGWQAWWFALSHSYDVYYSREITFCFWLQLFRPGKVVFEDHEPKRSWPWLYRFFVRHLTQKVVVAQGLKELYDQWGVDPTTYTIAPNGVDLTEFAALTNNRMVWTKLNLDPNRKIILYIGHFYKWKGVFTLLDAASQLPHSQIVLIGGTPEDRQNLEQTVAREQLTNVVVYEFVPHQQIIQYLKSADVLVLPNTGAEERSQKYTTPIKLFEYLASGVPLVASDLPSFRFYLTDGVNAKLCRPDNPTDLAQKITEVLEHPQLAEKLVAQALETVQSYTWDNRAKKVVSFLKT